MIVKLSSDLAQRCCENRPEKFDDNCQQDYLKSEDPNGTIELDSGKPFPSQRSECLACALIIHANRKDSAALIVAQVLGFAVPMGFTVLYSNRSKANGDELRRQAESGGQAQAQTESP